MPTPETIEPEVIPLEIAALIASAEGIAAAECAERKRRERTRRLALVLASLYRLAVVAGVGVLVWRGGSGWLLIAAVPLLWLSPKVPAA